MNKHKVEMSHNGHWINLGNKNINIKHDTRLSSISVDCGRDKTYICLSGKLNNDSDARILEVEGYNLEELSNLIMDLISLTEPKRFYLGKAGIGLGVIDYLLPKLEQNKIVLYETGELVYVKLAR